MDLNLLIDSNIPLLPSALKDFGGMKIFSGRELTNELIKSNNAKALFVRSTVKINKELLEGTEVEFIATATSGIDHIDLSYLKKNKIDFASALGSNANSVAEWVIYCSLLWADSNNINLSKKLIGIIGYGNVGKLVAKYADWMGLNVWINDPPLFDSGFDFPKQFEYHSLDDILKNCDVITNHVPLDLKGKYQTLNLINQDNINRVKKNALFIHASRGEVVNEDALIKKINRKEISAAIDVWENEPEVDPESIRAAMIATPHVAGHAFDGKIRGSIMVAEAFERHFNLKPDYSVFAKVLKDYNPLEKSKYKDHDFVYNKLKKSRLIDHDHWFFTNLIDLPNNIRTKEFENFRKNYPVRRESF